jgi:hypothetical protein
VNNQARAITGLLRSTPLAFLQGQSCLPSAKDLLDQRQTRYAVRAVSVDGDHPTHQLLPANFRLGELYGYGGGTPQLFSIGWTRPERTHRPFGSRLAQQIVKHVYYDTEYGFDLPCRQGLLVTAPTIWRHGLSRMPMRMLPDLPLQTTLFVELTKDISVGVGAAWKERDGWKTKTASLGRYVTESDATSFAIGMVLEDLSQMLSRTSQRSAEIATKSRSALTAMQNQSRWEVQTITNTKRHAKRVQEAGGTLALTWLSSSVSSNGYKAASVAAQRAARQSPKTVRSASLSYVKQAVKERWKPTTRLNKHVKDTMKSYAARYLQLKSGHAVTAVHLTRIGKAEDARWWWCNSCRQTVAHLLLKCRKRRRERETMVKKLKAKDITVSETPDWRDLEILFRDNAIVDMLRFVEKTDISEKRPGAGDDKVDSWDVERLDRRDEDGQKAM